MGGEKSPPTQMVISERPPPTKKPKVEGEKAIFLSEPRRSPKQQKEKIARRRRSCCNKNVCLWSSWKPGRSWLSKWVRTPEHSWCSVHLRRVDLDWRVWERSGEYLESSAQRANKTQLLFGKHSSWQAKTFCLGRYQYRPLESGPRVGSFSPGNAPAL